MRRAIVVGVDGSAESLEAVRWAAERAGVTGTHLHLVHVASPVALAPGVPLPGALPNVATMPNPSDMAAQEQADLELLDVGRRLRPRGTRRRPGQHRTPDGRRRARPRGGESAGLAGGARFLGTARGAGSTPVRVTGRPRHQPRGVPDRGGPRRRRRRGPVVVGSTGPRRRTMRHGSRSPKRHALAFRWSSSIPGAFRCSIDMVEAVATADLDDGEAAEERARRYWPTSSTRLRADHPDVQVQTQLTEQRSRRRRSSP